MAASPSTNGSSAAAGTLRSPGAVDYFRSVDAHVVFDRLANRLLQERPSTRSDVLCTLRNCIDAMDEDAGRRHPASHASSPARTGPVADVVKETLRRKGSRLGPDSIVPLPSADSHGLEGLLQRRSVSICVQASPVDTLKEMLAERSEIVVLTEWFEAAAQLCSEQAIKSVLAQRELADAGGPAKKETAQPTESGGKTKYGDGIASATAEYCRPVEYIPPDFEPSQDVDRIIDGMAEWSLPQGPLWDKQVVSCMAADCSMVARKWNDGYPPEVVKPLYYYTVDLHLEAIWAMWSDSSERWVRLDRHSTELLEAAVAVASDREDGETSRVLFERDLMVPQSAAAEIVANRGGSRRASSVDLLEHVVSFDFGMTVFSVAGRAATDSSGVEVHDSTVVRYVNIHGGSDDLSPFMDPALWLPVKRAALLEGKFRFDSFAKSTIPPPGVWESVSARSVNDVQVAKAWDVGPISCDLCSALVQDCYNQANQKKFVLEIHERLNSLRESRKEVVDGVSQRVFKTVVDGKIGKLEPTPEVVAHALSMQELRWQDRNFLVGLTGRPRVVVDKKSGQRNDMHRCTLSHPEQIFYHMNAAMRSLQFGTAEAIVSVETPEDDGASVTSDTTALEILQRAMKGQKRKLAFLEEKVNEDALQRLGIQSVVAWIKENLEVEDEIVTLQASQIDVSKVQPVDIICGDYVARGDPFHEQKQPFDRRDFPYHTISWAGDGHWKVEVQVDGLLAPDPQSAEFLVPDKLIKFSLGSWLLFSMRESIYMLDRALEQVPHPDSTVRSYRGIGGVTLPTDVYTRYAVVLWCAYSSTSEDQGVACGFANDSRGAAIFTLQGHSARQISFWSRFAREHEWLYPTNSRFQVTEVLDSDVSQILGKEHLQVFTLTEVTPVDAEVIAVRSMLRSATSLAQCNVIFSVVDALLSGIGSVELGIREGGQGGGVLAGWEVDVKVLYDAFGNCPAVTNAVPEEATQAADRLWCALEDTRLDGPVDLALCPLCDRERLRPMGAATSKWVCKTFVTLREEEEFQLPSVKSSPDKPAPTTHECRGKNTRGTPLYKCFACDRAHYCDLCHEAFLSEQQDFVELTTSLEGDGDEASGINVVFRCPPSADEGCVIIEFFEHAPQHVRRVDYIMDGARPRLFFPDLVGTDDSALCRVLLPWTIVTTVLPRLHRLMEKCGVKHNLPRALIPVSADDAGSVLSAPPTLPPTRCFIHACQELGMGPQQAYILYAIRHPPEPVPGSSVSRNPVCWEDDMMDQDGGEGSVGTVDGVHGVWSGQVVVRWPISADHFTYQWGGFSSNHKPGQFAVQPVEGESSAWAVRAKLRKRPSSEGLRLKPPGAQLLEAILSLGVKVQRVVLRGHSLGEEGAAAVMAGLRRNPNVTEVLLGRNPDPPISRDLVAMINLRCAAHSGSITMSQLLKVKRWPTVAAEALYDLRDWLCLPFEDFVLRSGESEKARKLLRTMLELRHAAGMSPVVKGGMLLWSCASWKGSEGVAIERATEFIDLGISVNETSRDKRTPLIYLFNQATPSLAHARFLLANGADVTPCDFKSKSALFYALDRHYFFGPAQRAAALEMLRQLSAGGVAGTPTSDGNFPILEACRGGLPEVAQVLIEAGVDLDVLDPSGFTALALALQNPAFDTEMGAKVRETLATDRAVRSLREPPLLYAPDPECVLMLLDKNADPGQRGGKKHRSAIYSHLGPPPERRSRSLWQFRAGTPEALAVLRRLATPSTINHKAHGETTPLANALRFCQPQVATLILELGGVVEGERETEEMTSGWTTLHHCVSNCAVRTQDELQMVKRVVEMMSRPSSRPSSVKCASPTHNVRVVSPTVEGLRDPVWPSLSYRTVSRKTPLIAAAKHGTPETVRLLLSLGSDPSCVDDQGFCALHHAVQRAHFQTGLAWFAEDCQQGTTIPKSEALLPPILRRVGSQQQVSPPPSRGGREDTPSAERVAKEQERAEWKKKVQERLDLLSVTCVSAAELEQLRDYEIAIIADDSESMKQPLGAGETKTRWDELKDFLGSIVEIAAVVDESGVDVHFVSRGTVTGVNSTMDSRMREILERGPARDSQSTPTLAARLRQVVASFGKSKPILVIMFFDDGLDEQADEFTRAIKGMTRDVNERIVKVHMISCIDQSDLQFVTKTKQDGWFLPVTIADRFDGGEAVPAETCDLDMGEREAAKRRDWIAGVFLQPVNSEAREEDRLAIGRWIWYGGEFRIVQHVGGSLALLDNGRKVVLRHPSELDLLPLPGFEHARWVAVYPDKHAMWVSIHGNELHLRMKQEYTALEPGTFAIATLCRAPEQGLMALSELCGRPRPGVKDPVNIAGHDDGMTPLHVAARSHCSVEVIQLLLDRGADTKARLADGKTPLQVARAASRREDVLNLLRSRTVEQRGTVTDDADELRALAAQNPDLVFTERMLERCGQDGYVVAMAEAKTTTRLQFEDGEALIFPASGVRLHGQRSHQQRKGLSVRTERGGRRSDRGEVLTPAQTSMGSGLRSDGLRGFSSLQ
eukprot:TRINITY_DN24799_c0_g1_i1.p1 TRINITY_DN24799_c0_g1~~TRINITY_DN24799_c0_g1_i1.p1  ORF type:complete len:2528 (+),score=726.29 TRINITY_DN24799_c0_g1_i1:56-7585(+)